MTRNNVKTYIGNLSGEKKSHKNIRMTLRETLYYLSTYLHISQIISSDRNVI